MFTAAFPVFVSVTVCDVFWPAKTFPKYTLAGETRRLVVLLGWRCWPETTPLQPFKTIKEISTKTKRRALVRSLPPCLWSFWTWLAMASALPLFMGPPSATLITSEGK
jgi:hypothetical protein